MIPVPPLDGYTVWSYFFPKLENFKHYLRRSNYGTIVFLGTLFILSHPISILSSELNDLLYGGIVLIVRSVV
jgi:hypothetical protein